MTTRVISSIYNQMYKQTTKNADASILQYQLARMSTSQISVNSEFLLMQQLSLSKKLVLKKNQGNNLIRNVVTFIEPRHEKPYFFANAKERRRSAASSFR